jgi:hypothetical protein
VHIADRARVLSIPQKKKKTKVEDLGKILILKLAQKERSVVKVHNYVR